MDFSRLHRAEALGVLGALVLVAALFLFNWYELGVTTLREEGEEDAFICGVGEYTCTGFDAFPILRWLLIAGCSAPLILAWIVIRGHKLSWPPGEVTMIVGFTATILITYNGIIDKPGQAFGEALISLQFGYWLALLGAISIAAAGLWRASVSAAAKPGGGTA